MAGNNTLNAKDSVNTPCANKSDVTAETKGDKRYLHVVQGSGSIIAGVIFDDAQVVSQGPLIDHAEYYCDGALVATVELTYDDTDKCNATRIRRI